MKLNKRLAALEKTLITEPTILVMEDGSTVNITGSLLPLLGAVFGAPNPQYAELLDQVCRSVQIIEPGGGHILELARAVLLSPGGLDESSEVEQ